MKTELNIMSQPWQNFCSANWDEHNIQFCTVKNVNQVLEPYNAYCTDLGEWRVFFNDEQSLTYFILKWS